MEDQSLFREINPCVYGPPPTEKDESILETASSNPTSNKAQDYLNDLVEAVCINGESFEKYEKILVKQCGNEVFAKMKIFVEEVQRSVGRRKFTETSVTNLKYLANQIPVPEDTVDSMMRHLNEWFAKEEQRLEEEKKRLDEQAEKLRKKEKNKQNMKQAGNIFVKVFKGIGKILLGLLKLAYLLFRIAIGIPVLVLFGFTYVPVSIFKPENQPKVSRVLRNTWNFICNKEGETQRIIVENYGRQIPIQQQPASGRCFRRFPSAYQGNF